MSTCKTVRSIMGCGEVLHLEQDGRLFQGAITRSVEGCVQVFMDEAGLRGCGVFSEIFLIQHIRKEDKDGIESGAI